MLHQKRRLNWGLRILDLRSSLPELRQAAPTDGGTGHIGLPPELASSSDDGPSIRQFGSSGGFEAHSFHSSIGKPLVGLLVCFDLLSSSALWEIEQVACDFIKWMIHEAMLDQFIAGSVGLPRGTRKGGRSSVFSLFNLKEKSRFWSESVIRGGGMLFIFSGASNFWILMLLDDMASYCSFSSVALGIHFQISMTWSLPAQEKWGLWIIPRQVVKTYALHLHIPASMLCLLSSSDSVILKMFRTLFALITSSIVPWVGRSLGEVFNGRMDWCTVKIIRSFQLWGIAPTGIVLAV